MAARRPGTFRIPDILHSERTFHEISLRNALLFPRRNYRYAIIGKFRREQSRMKQHACGRSNLDRFNFTFFLHQFRFYDEDHRARRGTSVRQACACLLVHSDHRTHGRCVHETNETMRARVLARMLARPLDSRSLCRSVERGFLSPPPVKGVKLRISRA
jgi:hypothetical protein